MSIEFISHERLISLKVVDCRLNKTIKKKNVFSIYMYHVFVLHDLFYCLLISGSYNQ